jgi:hypothetical protein
MIVRNISSYTSLIIIFYKDCLLTYSSFCHISPIAFKTKDKLKGTLKVCSPQYIGSDCRNPHQIEKNNKHPSLKGVDPEIENTS